MLRHAMGTSTSQKLLVERSVNVDDQNDNGETPLIRSAEGGYLWTPLHKASYCGHLHVAKLLLECGIDVDIWTGKKETPLFLAFSNGKLDVARFLIECGADVYAKNNNGGNPLHAASQQGHLDVVRMLIRLNRHRNCC